MGQNLFCLAAAAARSPPGSNGRAAHGEMLEAHLHVGAHLAMNRWTMGEIWRQKGHSKSAYSTTVIGALAGRRTGGGHGDRDRLERVRRLGALLDPVVDLLIGPSLDDLAHDVAREPLSRAARRRRLEAAGDRPRAAEVAVLRRNSPRSLALRRFRPRWRRRGPGPAIGCASAGAWPGASIATRAPAARVPCSASCSSLPVSDPERSIASHRGPAQARYTPRTSNPTSRRAGSRRSGGRRRPRRSNRHRISSPRTR